jgi:hypothetical protein
MQLYEVLNLKFFHIGKAYSGVVGNLALAIKNLPAKSWISQVVFTQAVM